MPQPKPEMEKVQRRHECPLSLKYSNFRPWGTQYYEVDGLFLVTSQER
jgi:hypothetical protein